MDIFTKMAPRPFQSISRNVRVLWKVMPSGVYFLKNSHTKNWWKDIGLRIIKLYLWVLASHPSVHSRGVSKGSVRDVSDMRQVTHKTWHMPWDNWHVTPDNFFKVIFWHRCYYLHMSRDSVSPLYRILDLINGLWWYILKFTL